MAAPGEEGEQLQKLLRQVEEVSKAIDNESDSNLADSDREDLKQISNVLEEIKRKISPQGKKDLPQSKRAELATLLPTIERALQQCKLRRRRPSEPAEHHPVERKMPSVTGCNPFKLRPSQKQQGGGGGGQEEEEAVSFKLLLRLTQNVLEPEQYYEWTTSYVDEERIYGWDKDADDVVAALVGPEDDSGGDQKLLFRAAGIAGIHGSGKTALAQKAFVHGRVKDNFPLRLWVCVGPPDSEDRFNLLYRMLDNLGLDTDKVERIVDESNVVKTKREAEKARIHKGEPITIEEMRKKAKTTMAEAAVNKDVQKKQEDETAKKPDDVKDATKEEGTVVAEPGAGEDAKEKEEEGSFQKLLKEKADNCDAVQKSKIGVLLYILHVTLSRTGYLIVFDDIRVYGDDGWYSNMTLPPPPEGEWWDRLAYGLPKSTKHKSAVLVTCRKEDDARAMVRTGRVFRPPKLELEDGWKLFKREYDQAKEKRKKDGKDAKGEDMLFKELEQMKEKIIKKCLGLPVAIIEAARGFVDLKPLPDASPLEEAAAAAAAAAKPAEEQTVSSGEKDKRAEEEEVDEAADKPED